MKKGLTRESPILVEKDNVKKLNSADSCAKFCSNNKCDGFRFVMEDGASTNPNLGTNPNLYTNPNLNPSQSLNIKTDIFKSSLASTSTSARAGTCHLSSSTVLKVGDRSEMSGWCPKGKAHPGSDSSHPNML